MCKLFYLLHDLWCSHVVRVFFLDEYNVYCNNHEVLYDLSHSTGKPMASDVIMNLMNVRVISSFHFDHPRITFLSEVDDFIDIPYIQINYN